MSFLQAKGQNDSKNGYSFAASLLLAVSLTGGTLCATGWWRLSQRQLDLQKELEQCQTLRQAERKGRIRAEIELRNVLTKHQQQENQRQRLDQENKKIEENQIKKPFMDGLEKEKSKEDIFLGEVLIDSDDEETGENKPDATQESVLQTQECDSSFAEETQEWIGRKDLVSLQQPRSMMLKEIGRVVSPFVKRMGTPRQGLLAPHARGFVTFYSDVPMACLLDGIEAYSHVWILFEFHANTNQGKEMRSTKVRPPRAPKGTKVGQLATRSPHRPNAIGLSLVKVDRLDKLHRRLHVKALDLVNDTPVYDIKPFVPWDNPTNVNNLSDQEFKTTVQVPSWVEQEDTIAVVRFTEGAQSSLEECLEKGQLEPLYHTGDYKEALQAISEILSQDPRASHIRNSNSNSVSDPTYRIMFGALEVEFVVLPMKESVEVVNITHVNLKEVQKAEGIPLLGPKNWKLQKSVLF